ncbi:MBL fold metallo-hydrolase [Xanthobacter autotrophicus DSM 431]|uniref:MBL fold metallo-hydrolase n=1 Tax=Xanthobacter nonsaccharivorans TaxID=3119912 RepID=UPI003728B741
MTIGLCDAVADNLSEVSPGLLRVRVPLPFPPSEVNAWLLSGPDGWTLIDSGIDDEPTRALFARALADTRLGGQPVARLLVTHFHPDHVGLAGWLHARTGADIHMSRVEWMQARLLLNEDPAEVVPQLVAHNRLCGAPAPFLDLVERRGMLYPKWVGPLPRRYLRVKEGDELMLGGSAWRVMIGEGHAPEMICLYCAERGLLIAADQILGRISPHIGTHPSDPLADPLGMFLNSLEQFEALPGDTLVLPSHGEPFHGLHRRIEALREHHDERLERLSSFCIEPRTVMDTLDVLFRPLPLEQIGFGLSEALAHLRYLVGRGELHLGLEGGRWAFVRR